MSSDVAVIELSSLKPGIILPAAIYDASNRSLLLLGKGVKLTSQNIARLESRGVSKVAISSEFADGVSSGGASSGGGDRSASGRSSTASQSQGASPPKKRVDSFQKRKEQEKQEKQRQEHAYAHTPLTEKIVRKKTVDFDLQMVDSLANLQAQSVGAISNFINQIAMDNLPNEKVLQAVTVDMVEQMVVDVDLFVKLAISNDTSDASEEHQHSLSVSQLSMAIAANLGMPQKQIEELGIGCMIYRAGSTENSQKMRKENRKLNDLDRLEFSKNPGKIFSKLEKLMDIPLGAKQVAYQIYERWNGTGYPRQKRGQQIHPLARIAMIADVYVALTSARPYRPAFEPYRAVEMLLHDTNKGLFDPEMVRGLLQTTSLFPLGSFVKLNDESVGEIVRANVMEFDRPLIKLIANSEGQMIRARKVDLAEELHLRVDSAMPKLELATFLRQRLAESREATEAPEVAAT